MDDTQSGSGREMDIDAKSPLPRDNAAQLNKDIENITRSLKKLTPPSGQVKDPSFLEEDDDNDVGTQYNFDSLSNVVRAAEGEEQKTPALAAGPEDQCDWIHPDNTECPFTVYGPCSECPDECKSVHFCENHYKHSVHEHMLPLFYPDKCDYPGCGKSGKEGCDRYVYCEPCGCLPGRYLYFCSDPVHRDHDTAHKDIPRYPLYGSKQDENLPVAENSPAALEDSTLTITVERVKNDNATCCDCRLLADCCFDKQEQDAKKKLFKELKWYKCCRENCSKLIFDECFAMTAQSEVCMCQDCFSFVHQNDPGSKDT